MRRRTKIRTRTPGVYSAVYDERMRLVQEVPVTPGRMGHRRSTPRATPSTYVTSASTHANRGEGPTSREVRTDRVHHGKSGASRFTGSGASAARRLLLAGPRGGLRGGVWVGHRHAEPGSGAPLGNPEAGHPGDLPNADHAGNGA